MMKRLMTLLFAAATLFAGAQIVETPDGAVTSIDGMTTRLIVYSPSVVRVVKYLGDTQPRNDNAVAPEAIVKPTEYERVNASHKHKINTGLFYAAINENDGNVSFWNNDGNLILAEQHKTGKIGANGNPKAVSQDFQLSLSEVSAVTGPDHGPAENSRRGKNVVLDSNASRVITTDKGFAIIWNNNGPGRFDDSASADARFSTDNAELIDYYFILLNDKATATQRP